MSFSKNLKIFFLQVALIKISLAIFIAYSMSYLNILTIFEFGDLNVKVITEANVQEVIEEMKTNQGQFLVYALDPLTFKNLAIGIEEIKRYIQQQKDIIVYYEKALTDDVTEGENND